MRLPDRRDEAYRIFRRASELLEPLVADSRSATAEHELSLILEHIAEIEHERGQAKEAIENIERSLAIESKLAAKDSGAVDPLISMAKGHALLGQILATQPDGTEPAIAANTSRPSNYSRKSIASTPSFPTKLLSLRCCLGDLSNLEQMAGRLDSALGSAGKADGNP